MEISKTKISRFSQLRNKKFRNEYGLFLVEGTKGVLDSIPAFCLENLIATKEWITDNSSDIQDIEAERILTATQKDLDKISSLSNPAQVIAVFRLPVEQLNLSRPLPADCYIVLDGIQDPGNLGTIIRTAHWFGIKHIFCSKDTVDAFNPKTVQSTMGSLAKVHVTYCDIIELLRSNPKLRSYALDLNGDNLFEQSSLSSGFFIFGREGSGLRSDVKKEVSDFLTIPPAIKENHPDSLNVAVAAAITMAQIKK